MKYRYVFCGDFHRTRIVDGKLHDDLDHCNFQIEVQIPIDYDTEEEALNCPCSLRFEVERGHVVLRIYSNWQYGIGENGKWFEHVDGSVIETIRWEEHWRYKASRSKVISRKMGVIISPCYDYIPDATPWDILFGIDNLPEEWGVTVEPMEYRIDVLDVD